MINSKTCIVIGDNHHNTLGVVRALGENGIKSIIVVLGSSDYLLSSSKYASVVHLIADEHELIALLEDNYSMSQHKYIIYTCCDRAASIIDSYSQKLTNNFVFFKAKEPGLINYFMDKNNMQIEALKCGIACPKTITVTSESDCINFPMPCMLKPLNSLDAGKSELKYCSSYEEFKTLVTPGLSYQLQEYIHKDFELSIVGCSINQGRKLIIPGVIRKIREYPFRKGSSSYAVLDKISNYSCIDVDAITKLFSSIGYEGLFSIEFLYKDGVAYFLEINMRNDGNGYIPNAAGVNLPYIYYQYIISGTIEEKVPSLPVFFMNDNTDWIYVLKGQLGIWEWLKSVQATNVYLLWNKNDIKPFIYNIKEIITRKINRIFNKNE